jgi:uncharacterized protein with ATP-grasp and redox domains
MKIQSECVPCLIKRIIFETQLSTEKKEIQTNVIKNTCKVLSEIYDPGISSAEIATKVHKLAYEILGDEDPYYDLKNISNEVAKSLIPKTEEILKKSDDPLKASMLCSIIGNILDFGIEGASSNPKKFSEIFDRLYSEGLGHDDYIKVKELIDKSKNLTYFCDNCGEIVFDRVVCRELKKFNPKIQINLVVRGKPIISDATIEDADELNFSDIVDNIFTTGCFAIGVNFEKMPVELKKELTRSDIILCKGMANYEAFSETNYSPIVYLLRTKCNAIANSMNLPINQNVIKLYE